jgi:hypothetical protein
LATEAPKERGKTQRKMARLVNFKMKAQPLEREKNKCEENTIQQTNMPTDTASR